MYQYLKKVHVINKGSLPYYSQLIDCCFSLTSYDFAKTIHAQLIKLGFNRHTYLGNRCLDLYSHFGNVADVPKVFDDIPDRNCISWNICLKGLLKFGQIESGQRLFDEMPERDVVSWNSMISGYVACGYLDYALEMFYRMQIAGIRPSGFTFSILLSSVSTSSYGKQVHGSMIRSSASSSNVVLGNSLIDMYGKFGLVDYALGVFFTMEKVDVISWNSLILGCSKSGYGEMALDQFIMMRSLGYLPDEFTVSTVIAVCSNLQNLGKGKQVFCFSVKSGLLSNSIVLSAVIDLFSKCNRLEDSARLFEEVDRRDIAIINSMISGYARHGFVEDALKLFVFLLQENSKPNEFTISSVISSISILLLENGTQVHSLVVKLGLELDTIVASSLMDMYANFGCIDSAMKIFCHMNFKDLISWNTIIMGLSLNGRVVEAMKMFAELLKKGISPDQITLTGVLLACNYGSLLDEGMLIFSSMEKKFGITPLFEHYVCLIELLCEVGKLREAIDIAETMPHKPNALIWDLILRTCAAHGDLKLAEKIAERMIKLEPQSGLPYYYLAQVYETSGRWEGIVRVRKAMRQRGIKRVTGYSWIGIRNRVYSFKADELEQHGGKDVYQMLRMLNWEMEDDV